MHSSFAIVPKKPPIVVEFSGAKIGKFGKPPDESCCFFIEIYDCPCIGFAPTTIFWRQEKKVKGDDPKVLKCPVGTAPVVVRNRRQTEWNTGLVRIFLRREGGKPEGLIPLIGVVSGL